VPVKGASETGMRVWTVEGPARTNCQGASGVTMNSGAHLPLFLHSLPLPLSPSPYPPSFPSLHTPSLPSPSSPSLFRSLSFPFPPYVSRQLSSPWQLTIIGWSMSSRPNTPYRPCLCSHDVSKTDMELQAPDTRHQAPYIPDTCFVCVTVRRRHLDLTVS